MISQQTNELAELIYAQSVPQQTFKGYLSIFRNLTDSQPLADAVLDRLAEQAAALAAAAARLAGRHTAQPAWTRHDKKAETRTDLDRKGEPAEAGAAHPARGSCKSYHAAHRVGEDDIFDNRLIFGDNLLALKALEQEFAGKVKCIFIDPPYNTGSAFEHYDDGLEHSIWLSLDAGSAGNPSRLLSEDGSLWITIDDNEAHYLKVFCDEIFGRRNFVANVVWQKRYSASNRRQRIRIDTMTISCL